MKSWRIVGIVLGVLLASFGSVQVADTATSVGRWMTVTAYCSCTKCCGEHAAGYFASGEKVYWGGVAADWRVLPPGTKVEIQGFIGTFEVEDTGRVIKGPRLDIWMPTHREAKEFGKQRLWVARNAR
ncbi:MAG: 3D domain-containing protein [Verrucomicrobia bacterium]|nr:3D domain-containing protein [Verrucomicrobiota bacterium]